MTEPKGRIRVCAADDIKPGEILGVEISGLPKLAIYRVGFQIQVPILDHTKDE